MYPTNGTMCIYLYTSTTTFVYPIINADVGSVLTVTMGSGAYIKVPENGKIGIVNEEYSNGNIQQMQVFSNQIVDTTALKACLGNFVLRGTRYGHSIGVKI